jgi:hypothetical protein
MRRLYINEPLGLRLPLLLACKKLQFLLTFYSPCKSRKFALGPVDRSTVLRCFYYHLEYYCMSCLFSNSCMNIWRSFFLTPTFSYLHVASCIHHHPMNILLPFLVLCTAVINSSAAQKYYIRLTYYYFRRRRSKTPTIL